MRYGSGKHQHATPCADQLSYSPAPAWSLAHAPTAYLIAFPAALQDAILLGRLEVFSEFSKVDNFYSLFRRLLGFSVSSLKNRLKKVFLDSQSLDQSFWGFGV